jgi:hypothetical protein
MMAAVSSTRAGTATSTFWILFQQRLYIRTTGFQGHGAGREETVWLMGQQGLERFEQLTAEPPPFVSRAFDAGGLYVLASAEPLPCQIVIDAGPMGAFSGGHGHADALSLQLTAAGRHWVADPGTYCSGNFQNATASAGHRRTAPFRWMDSIIRPGGPLGDLCLRRG